MLFRILGLIIAALIIGLGVIFVKVGTFGPMLTGSALWTLGAVLMIVIIYDTLSIIQLRLEQKVNDNRPVEGQIDLIAEYEEARLDAAVAERLAALGYHPGTADPYSWYSPEELAALNTPDPHLIHPDDLKRSFIATIEHRDGHAPKIIDIKV